MRRREAVLTGTAAAWAVRKPYRPARHCQAQAVSTVPYSTLQLQCCATIQRPRKDVRQPSRKREGRSSTRLAPLPRPKVVALPLALATWRGKGRSEGSPPALPYRRLTATGPRILHTKTPPARQARLVGQWQLLARPALVLDGVPKSLIALFPWWS